MTLVRGTTVYQLAIDSEGKVLHAEVVESDLPQDLTEWLGRSVYRGAFTPATDNEPATREFRFPFGLDIP